MKESKKYLGLLLIVYISLTGYVNGIAVGSCVSYSLDGSRCEECVSNYHIQEGRCYMDILGCRRYKFGNICQQCDRDYILVNNYCCDRVCISQMYKQENSTSLSLEMDSEQTERLQQVLLKAKSQLGLQTEVRVSSISFKKYQDVMRFFLLYEFTSGPYRWKRMVYDYHYLSKLFILADQSLLNTNINFHIIPYVSVTDTDQKRTVLSLFSTMYKNTVEPSMCMIKKATLSSIDQYEIMVPDMGYLKSVYLSQKNETITLYSITLTPQYFKVVLMGDYLLSSLEKVGFLTACRSVIENNSSYSDSRIKGVQVYNSSLVNEGLKVMVYSQGESKVIRTVFEVTYSSVDVISETKIISSTEQHITNPSIMWSGYLLARNSELQKALQLLLSGYNSSNQIPSDYKVPNSTYNQLQFECKIQKWKPFTKFHIIVHSDRFKISAKVIKIDSTNLYKIERFTKVQNVTKTVQKQLNVLVDNFTLNQTKYSYQHTISGWSDIQKRLLEKGSLKSIVEWFFKTNQYKLMGFQANITKIIQIVNQTVENYTFLCENSTHYMKAIVIRNIELNTLKIQRAQQIEKQQKDFPNNYINSYLNKKYHYYNDSANGIYVYYSHNSMWTLYNYFTYPHVKNLQQRFRETYQQYYYNSSSPFLDAQDDYFNKAIINKTYPYTGSRCVLEYHNCPTSPYTEYHWMFGVSGRPDYCYILKFLQINQNNQSKMIYTGYNREYTYENCNYIYLFKTQFNFTVTYPKSNLTTNDILTVKYGDFYVTKDTFNLSIPEMNGTFDQYMMKNYPSEINNIYKSYKNEEYYQLEKFNRYSPYIRWTSFKTDQRKNITYQIVSYLPSSYTMDKPIPNYSGNFQRQYHHMCPGVNRTALFGSNMNKYMYWKDSFWFNYKVNDWYSQVIGKDLVYNTQFIKNTTSTLDKLITSQSFKLLSSTINALNGSSSIMVNGSSSIMVNGSYFELTNNESNFILKEMVKVEYQFSHVYLMRVNVSRNQSMDLLVLYHKGDKTIQLVSWMPFEKQHLMNFTIMNKQKTYERVEQNNTTHNYLKDILRQESSVYLQKKFAQLDLLIDNNFKSKLEQQNRKSINVSIDLVVNKLYYNIQRVSGDLSMIGWIFEVRKRSLDTNIDVLEQTKSYYRVDVMLKWNLTKNSVNNDTQARYWVYLLGYSEILTNISDNNSFYSKKTVNQSTIEQKIVNYTVSFSLDQHYHQIQSTSSNQTNISQSTNTSQSPNTNVNQSTGSTQNTETNQSLLFNNSASSNNTSVNQSETSGSDSNGGQSDGSYFNVVKQVNTTTLQSQISSVSSSQTGRVLLYDQLVSVKYYPSPDMLSSQQYTMMLNHTMTEILNTIQSKCTTIIYKENITSTILILERLSDSQKIVSYSILMKSVLNSSSTNQSINTSYNLSSTTQMTTYIIRFTYIYDLNALRFMGLSVIAPNRYGEITRDIKSEGNLYFESLGRVTNMNQISSLIYSLVDLVNGYLRSNQVVDRVQRVEQFYYRNLISGGFYKIELGLLSGRLATGYILEQNYTYSVIKVRIIADSNPISDNTQTVISDSSENNTGGISNGDDQDQPYNGANQTNTSDGSDSSHITVDKNSSSTIDDEEQIYNQENTTTNNNNISSNQPNINSNQTITNNDITNYTANTTNTNSTPANDNTVNSVDSSLMGLLEKEIFFSLTADNFILYLRQIILKLKLQFPLLLNNLYTYIVSYSISQSPDGQFYLLKYHSNRQDPLLIHIDLIVYRCNSTCVMYKGEDGSLFLLGFTHTQLSQNGTVINTKDLLTDINKRDQNSQSQLISIITESFFYSTTNNSSNTSISNNINNNDNNSQSKYEIPPNEQQWVLSIFESIYNKQSVTNIDPQLLQYQKYHQFLKSHLTLILHSNSVIIDRNGLSQQISQSVKFVKQKYSLLFNNSIVLLILKDNNQTKDNINIINNSTYFNNNAINVLKKITNLTIYLVSQNRQTTNWIIYKVSLLCQQIEKKNYKITIQSIIEWAKNGELTNNISSMISNQYNKQQSDIAFGYQSVSIESVSNESEFLTIMQELNGKYYPLLVNKTLTKVQRLQLKNGTNNYKLFFSDSVTNKQLKIIALYRQDQHRVQILNKLYLPLQHYQPLSQTQLSSVNILNDTISLLKNLHSQQLSSQFITVTKVEVSSPTYSFQPQTQRYRIHMTLPEGKVYSSIIDYNSNLNSLNQVSFNQIIQLPKDSTYRLNVYQKYHSDGFTKLQQKQWANDSMYAIVLNKLKSYDANYVKTVLVFRKLQTFRSIYKLIYQTFDSSSLTTIRLSETKISVDPSKQKIQFSEYPSKLNFTSGFTLIKQSQISEQQLIDSVNQFRTINKISSESQILVNSTMKKQFINGLLLKMILNVKSTDNKIQSYEIIGFRQFYQAKFTLWTFTSLLQNFQSPCSQYLNCSQCPNSLHYTLNEDKTCSKIIKNCLIYFKQAKTNILECQKCTDGFYLFQNECLHKSLYSQLWN